MPHSSNSGESNFLMKIPFDKWKRKRQNGRMYKALVSKMVEIGSMTWLSSCIVANVNYQLVVIVTQ